MHPFDLDPLDLSPEAAVAVAGPAGALAGRWRPAPRNRHPRGSLVVAHPHPQQGGTMLNKVVFHTARSLGHGFDLAALRFNFRGVDGSEGAYDAGRGEVEDVLAAWDEASRRVPGLPLVAAGYSFGAAVTLRAAARRVNEGARAPEALVVLGLPVGLLPPPDPFPGSIPLVAVHGDLDQHTPAEEVERYLEGWRGPKALAVIPAADHFFGGALPRAMKALTGHLKELL